MSKVKPSSWLKGPRLVGCRVAIAIRPNFVENRHNGSFASNMQEQEAASLRTRREDGVSGKCQKRVNARSENNKSEQGLWSFLLFRSFKPLAALKASYIFPSLRSSSCGKFTTALLATFGACASAWVLLLHWLQGCFGYGLCTSGASAVTM